MFAALKAKAKGTVALRANALQVVSPLEVNEPEGVIHNAAVMVIGPAMGWGFQIDEITLRQTADLINAEPNGVKMRFKHPQFIDDDAIGQPVEDLGTEVGYLRNARVDGDALRGDIYLGDYAESLPGMGNVKAYLLKKAKGDPGGIGLSAVIGYEQEENPDPAGEPLARVFLVSAVDFVGRGAATPNGLLSAKTNDPAPAGSKTHPFAAPAPANSNANTGVPMDPKLKQYLIDNFDLPADASDEDAQALYDSLTPEQQAECQAALAAQPEGEGEPPAPPAEEPKKPAVPPAASMSARATREGIITDNGDRLLAQEGKRVAQLQQLGTTLKVPQDVIALSIAAGDTVIDARKKFLAHLQEKAKPIHSVKVGTDLKMAALNAAIPDALLMRSGRTVVKPHDMAPKLARLTALAMFQHYLAALGIKEAFEMSKPQLVEIMGPRRFARAYPQYAALAQSTSDFGSILENTMRKSLRTAYEEYPKTWNKWARRNTTPDFKIISRPQLSQAPDLVERAEGGEIKYATITDGKETYRVKEYVSGIKLTRQALINDDLDAFNTLPQKQAQAAARLEDAITYGVLTANGNLADGGALFNSTATSATGSGHANLAGTGAAPTTVTALEATQKLMRLQKGLGNVGRLNLSPKFLLVPVALEVSATQFISSNVDPSKSNQVPNPFSGRFQVIASPFLDDSSSMAWYLAADPGMIDTVEVCFLTDEPEPVLRQETDFDTEDAKFAVRHTIGAAALDFRGLVKNPGA